jgi:site-specific DNA-methyltransferase (adenine-specific)
MELNKIWNEDCRTTIARLPNRSIDLIVTSPPYYNQRSYNIDTDDSILGEESHHSLFIDNLVNIFIQAKDILKDTGSIWVNIGDTYKSSVQKSEIKNKFLIGIPDRFKIAMIDAGFICRNEIIWHKTACKPESVKDRFTTNFEKLYFFTKEPNYFFNKQEEPCLEVSIKDIYKDRGTTKYDKSDYLFKSSAQTIDKARIGVKEKVKVSLLEKPKTVIKGESKWYERGMRNKRCVWSMSTSEPSLRNSKIKHHAPYPLELITVPILACSPKGGVVYDPFMGSGSTAVVCIDHNRYYVGSELSKEYHGGGIERLLEKAKQMRLL